MKFKAIKHFSSIRWGNVKPGDYIELDKSIASQMIKSGMVELPAEMAEQLRQQQIQAEKKEAKK